MLPVPAGDTQKIVRRTASPMRSSQRATRTGHHGKIIFMQSAVSTSARHRLQSWQRRRRELYIKITAPCGNGPHCDVHDIDTRLQEMDRRGVAVSAQPHFLCKPQRDADAPQVPLPLGKPPLIPRHFP